MGIRSGETLRVRNALELVGLEEEAHYVVAALGARDLVIVDRRKLLDEQWLLDRVDLLRTAKSIRPYREQQ